MAARYGIRLLVAGVAIIFGFSFLAGMAALADDKAGRKRNRIAIVMEKKRLILQLARGKT